MKLKVSREDAKKRLDEQIAKGTVLHRNPYPALEDFKQELEKWRSFNEDLLSYIFTDSKNATEFSNIGNGAFLLFMQRDEENLKGYKKELTKQVSYLESCIDRLSLYAEPSQAISSVPSPIAKTGSHLYVNLHRISQLKNLKNYDPLTLIRLCEELNEAFKVENFLSTIMLLRAVLDHVPPIFEFDSFSKVANNYAGSKSFKESMLRLETSSRRIADSHLHTHIRTKESLPNSTQVDFSNDLDVLLGEIVRIGC